MTAGLDRYPRLDLEAHRDLFGRLPRLSDAELIWMAQQVDLRGHGGAAFPAARKLQAVVDASRKKRAADDRGGERDRGRTGQLQGQDAADEVALPGAVRCRAGGGGHRGRGDHRRGRRERTGQPVAGGGIAAEPGLRDLVRVVEVPERFISGESGALIRAINGKSPVPPGRKTLAAESGVYGLPTLLSNAETFAQLAVLALLGPERYASVGMPEEPGTVLLSVSGSAARPRSSRCRPVCRSVRYSTSARRPRATACSSAATTECGCPPRMPTSCRCHAPGWRRSAERSGAGIVLPLGDGTCPLGEVSRIASYLAGESAGQCGPCKLGLPRIARALAALIDGSGGIEALDVARRSAAPCRDAARAPIRTA